MKLPAFQFYPGDWMKDPALRRCSFAAKGVLIEVLCLMFENSPRGCLITGSQPWSLKEVAGAVGGDPAEAFKGVEELIAKGALKRKEDGTIYSSRMEKDESLRKLRSECGKLGGNPDLLKQNRSKKEPPAYSTPEGEDEGEDSSAVFGNGDGRGKGHKHPELAEVLTLAERTGLPPDEAKSFWNHFEATGWIDKNGHAIVRWQSKLESWKINYQSGVHQRNQANGRPKALTIFELTKMLEAKEKIALGIKNKWSSEAAMGTQWKDENKRKEWQKLRAEIKDLQTKIANGGL